jgi:hypothetical protein
MGSSRSEGSKANGCSSVIFSPELSCLNRQKKQVAALKGTLMRVDHKTKQFQRERLTSLLIVLVQDELLRHNVSNSVIRRVAVSAKTVAASGPVGRSMLFSREGLCVSRKSGLMYSSGLCIRKKTEQKKRRGGSKGTTTTEFGKKFLGPSEKFELKESPL